MFIFEIRSDKINFLFDDLVFLLDKHETLKYETNLQIQSLHSFPCLFWLWCLGLKLEVALDMGDKHSNEELYFQPPYPPVARL